MLACAATAAAQPAEGEPRVTPLLENVTRLDGWSFFAPGVGPAEPEYTLFGNRATLGARVGGRRFAVDGAFRYAQLVGLPRGASAPAPLGPGGVYFAAARNTRAYQLYIRTMSAAVTSGAVTVRGGRMSYASNEDTVFAGRLVGDAEWTIFERAFDGVRLDVAHPRWRAHASFLMPTQGAFEESASPTMTRLRITTLSASVKPLQVFAHNYRDTRAVRARPDNIGLAAGAVDVDVHTLGATISVPWLSGWAAWQRGRWFGEPHRAFSGIVRAHVQGAARWQPAVVAAVAYASGDDDPLDRRHRTFFPMIPTSRPETLAGTFAQMNLREVSIAGAVRPVERLKLAIAVHDFSLVSARDRWYSGTGATAFAGQYFGFSTRASRGATRLGTYLESSALFQVGEPWSVKLTVGALRGDDVVRRQFVGRWLRVASVESRVSFSSHETARWSGKQ